VQIDDFMESAMDNPTILYFVRQPDGLELVSPVYESDDETQVCVVLPMALAA
jgi:hypothetical protein